MKNLLFVLLLAFCVNSMYAAAPLSVNNTEQQTPKKKKTTRKKVAKKSFVGKHMLSLQWISWEKFGEATISNTNEEGVYKIKGLQDSKCCNEADGYKNQDFLSIDGTIRKVDEKTLIFNGTIITRVYHINGGKDVVREGEFTFLSTEGRKYWRLQEMKNPVDQCVDYVDIYF